MAAELANSSAAAASGRASAAMRRGSCSWVVALFIFALSGADAIALTPSSWRTTPTTARAASPLVAMAATLDADVVGTEVVNDADGDPDGEACEPVVEGTDVGCDVADPSRFRRGLFAPVGTTWRFVARTCLIWRCVVAQLCRVVLYRRRFAGNSGTEAASRERTRLAEKLRDTLIQLGPTFIKCGQLLSTRVDVVPAEVIAELARLQNEVPPFPTRRAKAVIRRSLGRRPEEIFEEFDDTPLAAASLAQVHRAKYNGEDVVVKVQRENLRELFDVDLWNIRLVARLADALDPQTEAVQSNWIGVAETSGEVLYREIDFNFERKSAERFAKNFEKFREVKVPLMVPELCASRVLTMEYCPGVKISDTQALVEGGFSTEKIASVLTRSYMEQLCNHGFFHCDPHPGNLAVDDGDPGGRLIYYDYGMMEEVEPNVKKGFVDLTYATYKNLPIDAVDALETMGVLRAGLDRFSIERIAKNMLNQFEATLGKKGAKPQWENEMSAEEQKRLRRERRAKLGQDLFATQAERPFLFPPKFTFVFRAFGTIDGIGKGLTPTYDLVRLSQPYLRQLADMRDGSRYKTALNEVGEKLGLRPVDIGAVVQQPRKVQSLANSVKRIEDGDLKLRVRTLEVERMLERVEARQQMTSASIGFVALCMAARELWKDGGASKAVMVAAKAALLGALKMAYDLWAAWSTLREKEAQRRRFANEGTDDVKKWTLV